jgi:enterochelin esterase-like enzyme
MRRMKTRQATKLLTTLLTLLAIFTACSPSNQPIPTFTPIPIIASSTPKPIPTIKVTATSTPLTCLTLPGRVEEGALDSFRPPQQFRIYLPPCYDEKTDQHYPVLYLLHGQTYNDDQWIRLGAVSILDELITSGESEPFIVVFPDDRYWNLPAGPGFGDRLVNALIPYVDATYRTIPDREHRAIGGMSRGAGWSLRLGLTHSDLFGIIGLHSLAVLQKDASRVGEWINNIPPSSRPQIFMDIGDHDTELLMAEEIESLFNDYDMSHEWHLYSGDHTENYWSAHTKEYIRWYAEQWKRR